MWGILTVDAHLDYALFSPGTRQTAIWYLSGLTITRTAYGPTVASGYDLVGTADFDGDAKPDYVLHNGKHGPNGDLVFDGQHVQRQRLWTDASGRLEFGGS